MVNTNESMLNFKELSFLLVHSKAESARLLLDVIVCQDVLR